jgi:hypothetical protein
MNPLWDYFWPCFAGGLVTGVLAGIIGFRPGANRIAALGLGLLAGFLITALWHGPLGGANRYSVKVELIIKQVLVYYEMPRLTAHLHRDPLTREIILSGPADDFQHSEMARLLGQIPGVRRAAWAPAGGGVPLIGEAMAMSMMGFLFGLLVAYLLELRRRYNAQWNW